MEFGKSACIHWQKHLLCSDVKHGGHWFPGWFPEAEALILLLWTNLTVNCRPQWRLTPLNSTEQTYGFLSKGWMSFWLSPREKRVKENLYLHHADLQELCSFNWRLGCSNNGLSLSADRRKWKNPMEQKSAKERRSSSFLINKLKNEWDDDDDSKKQRWGRGRAGGLTQCAHWRQTDI